MPIYGMKPPCSLRCADMSCILKGVRNGIVVMEEGKNGGFVNSRVLQILTTDDHDYHCILLEHIFSSLCVLSKLHTRRACQRAKVNT